VAYSALNSSSQYTLILIDQNNNDDWSVSSPFSTLMDTGDDGFAFGTINSSSLTDYTLISNILKSVGNVNRSVDIFNSENRVLQNEVEVKGIGGVASSGDFSFEFENTAGNIDPVKLLGRKITVLLGNGTSLSESTNVETIFVGKVYEVVPTKQCLEFICRSNSQLWDKELGTETGFESDSIYNSSIYPLIYGDHLDDFAYMPFVLSDGVTDLPSLYLDNKKLNQIDSLYIYDDENNVAYPIESTEQDLTINADSYKIELKSEVQDIYLTEEIDETDGYIKIWNPPYMIIEADITPSPALDEHSSIAAGTIYEDTEGNKYECLKQEDELISFSVYEDNIISSKSNFTLSKLGAGSGPATINALWRTPKLTENIELESIESVYPYISNPYQYTLSMNKAIKASTNPLIFKVEDELIFAYRKSYVEDSDLYSETIYFVLRGYNGTSSVAHVVSSDIYKVESDPKSYGWKVKFRVPVTDLCGFEHQGYVRYLSDECGTQIFQYEEYDDGFKGWGIRIFPKTADDKSMYLHMDMKFPSISIDGIVTNMYLLGSYSILASSINPDMDSGIHDIHSLVIGRGGKVTPARCIFQHSIGPNLIPGLPERLSMGLKKSCEIRGAGNAVIQHGVGYLKDSAIAKTSYFENIYVLAFQGYIRDTESGVDSFLLMEGFSSLPAPARLRPPEILMNKQESEKEFDLSYPYVFEAYLNSDKEEALKVDDWDGMLNNVKDLQTERYFFTYTNGTSDSVITPQNAVLFIDKPGFLIEANINPLKVRLWGRGSGRVFDSGITYYNGVAGNLITNPVSIIEDLARRELGLTDATIDEDSFDASYTERQSWSNSLSIYGNRVYFRDIVKKVAIESGLIVSETNDGKLKVSTLDIPEDTSGSREVLDSELIISGNVPKYNEEYTIITDLITDLSLNYRYNLAVETYGENILSSVIPGVSDLTENALDILDEERRANIDLETHRDRNSVNYFASLLMQYHNRPLRILTVSGTLSLRDIEVGDWCHFETDDYILGTSNKIYLCIQTGLQPKFKDNKPEYTFKLIELDAGGYGCAIYESVLDDDEIQEVTSGLDEIQETTECT